MRSNSDAMKVFLDAYGNLPYTLNITTVGLYAFR